MKEYIIASNNKHKVEEIENILNNKIKLITLNGIGFKGEIPEEQDSLEGNANQKSRFIWDRFKRNCFADDTGLEIEALGGRPGVYSARYAGKACNFEDNIDLVLEEMESKTNRKARFRTVISLIEDGKEFLFEGICYGDISTERYGRKGFGYDPIFIPKGYGESFGEMSIEDKNKISHRALAIEKLANHLLK